MGLAYPSIGSSRVRVVPPVGKVMASFSKGSAPATPIDHLAVVARALTFESLEYGRRLRFIGGARWDSMRFRFQKWIREGGSEKRRFERIRLLGIWNNF